METYIRNANCPCMRCRMNQMMGPALLITVGVLGLLASWRMAGFGDTWPLILIVIGAVKIMQSSVSTEGHIQPGVVPAGQIPPVPPPPPGTTSTTTSGVSNG